MNNSVAIDANGAPKSLRGVPKDEETPSAARDPAEFIEMGGKGDQFLYDGDSIYSKDEVGAKVRQ